MTQRPGIQERAVAAAALAGREQGVSLGPKAAQLAERHSLEDLREMSTSDAAAEARAQKRRVRSEEK